MKKPIKKDQKGINVAYFTGTEIRLREPIAIVYETEEELLTKTRIALIREILKVMENPTEDEEEINIK